MVQSGSILLTSGLLVCHIENMVPLDIDRGLWLDPRVAMSIVCSDKAEMGSPLKVTAKIFAY